jgi:DNA modification methylase
VVVSLFLTPPSTVKPLALMRWLVRLVTPPGGVVLDPFAGSGTTGEAALLEGFDAVLVERDESYLPLIAHRLERDLTLDLAAPA